MQSPSEMIFAKDEQPVWHKPSLTRLVVSLDTAAAPGSVTDGESGSVVGN